MIDHEVNQVVQALREQLKSGRLNADDHDSMVSIIVAAYTFRLICKAADQVLTPAFMNLHRSMVDIGRYMETLHD